ncbi:MAG: carboxypeptidase regulatory-like domain-containing protein, partial [Planctomycetota bacterium]
MGISFIVIAGVVVLILGLALAFGGGKAIPWILGLLGLLVVGVAGVFMLRAAPVQPVVVQTNTAGAAVVANNAATPVVTAPEDPVELRSLSGIVLQDADEAPVAGAAIEVFDQAAGWAPFGTPSSNAVTDDEGRFTLEGVRTERTRVRASYAGLAPQTLTATAEHEGELVFRLREPGTVAGRVVEAETETPLENVMVLAGDAVGVRTDSDGKFTLEDVPSGEFDLLAQVKGYVTLTHEADTTAEDAMDLVLEMEPSAWVGGIVLDESGNAVAGAKVVVGSGIDAPMVGRVVTVNHEVTSGPDGRFKATSLRAGRSFTLHASTADSISPEVETPKLEKGESLDDIELRLEPAAVLMVTVKDAEGNPVADASVRHEAIEAEDTVSVSGPGFVQDMLNVAMPGAARTDESGKARLAPVKPGPTKVTVTRQDFRTANSEAAAVSGEVVSVEITLDPGAVITGTVVDDQGEPVGGAKVVAQRLAMGDIVRQERMTDGEGKFSIGGLHGKGFTVSASHERYVESSLNNIDPEAGPVVVTLQRGGGLVGVAVDFEGNPVTKFRVSKKRTDTEEQPNPMNFARFAQDYMGTNFEDEGGNFRLDGLEPGIYEITVNAEGLAPGRVADVEITADEETAITVELPEGLTLRGIVVKKEDGAPVAGARVKVAGEGLFGQMDMEFDVGDDDLGAMAGARDAFEMFGGGSGNDTGADGTFEIKGLEPGSINLQISARGLAPGSVKGVRLPASDELRIELEQEAAIEGVVFADDGAPKSGAMVMLQRIPTFMRMTRTKDDGSYKIGGLAAGTYLFYVMENPAAGLQNFNFKSESVRLEQGKTTRKDHHLGEGIRVTGRVTRGGKPVTSIMVMLMPGSGDSSPMSAMSGAGAGGGFAMGATNENGEYTITGVKPGRYSIMVQSGFGGAPSSGDPVDIPEGSTVIRRDIEMPQNQVGGVVVDDSGKPVPGATVTAVRTGRNTTRAENMGDALDSMGGMTISDDEGRFLIDDMRAGSYTIRVQAQGFGTAIQENVTATSKSPDLRIVLEKGLEVRVKVIGPDGQPVGGAGIYMSNDNDVELSNMAMFDTMRTDSKGQVKVQLPQGTVKLEALVAGFGPATKTITVPHAGEVVLQLPKGANLQVTVTGSTGMPVAGASVQILDDQGRPFVRRLAMEN